MSNPRCALAVLSLLLLAGLTGCGEATQAEHQKTVEQLAKAQAACDKADQELLGKAAELAKTKGSLEKANDDLAQALTDHATQGTKLQTQLQAEKANAAKLADANTKLTQDNADAVKQLDAYKQDIANAKQKIADAEGKIAALEALVKKLQAQIAAPAVRHAPLE